MFKKILLAVTPQIDVLTAPKTAFELARSCGAELMLFHALPIGKDEWCSFDETIPKTTLLDCAKAKIADAYAADLDGIPNHSIRVVAGSPDEEMLKIIHTEGVDLIIMGHHTQAVQRPDRMWGMVDTTIRRVCANVHAPVMVVTNKTTQDSIIKRIVMATDFSTPSDSALCYASQLARAFGAHLDIFHVLDVGQSSPNPKYYMQSMDVFIDKALERMQRKYGKAVEGISHSFYCWEGIPYIEILKQARWQEADVVVMAQYSTSETTAKPSVGSTCIQVALSPGCPVIIVNYRARVCMQVIRMTARLTLYYNCLLYTSPSPRDLSTSRMPSSA
eukprot:TRINITY_DN9746_c0_g1_i3.p2 TRINITY_DN9746_c0_g1~~TRINITY_DN9746_c0_g1_i3.p2  ORF type:complete len:332 (+),score=68.83 TRINITY_DN9746_c0_g1_i3:900-1895(+)